MNESKVFTTDDLRAMLAEKYKAPEFAFLEEVSNGTGANRNRSADAIARYCDFWYLVVSDKGIVQNGELPSAWGLIAPRNDRLVVCKEADKLSPLQMNRTFLAALLRRSSESERRTFDIELNRAIERAKKEGHESGQSKSTREAEQWKRQYEELQASLKDFEEKSGIKVTQYGCGRIGDELHEYQVKKGNIQYMESRLNEIKSTAERILFALNKKGE